MSALETVEASSSVANKSKKKRPRSKHYQRKVLKKNAKKRRKALVHPLSFVLAADSMI
jgi:hypothetical protein